MIVRSMAKFVSEDVKYDFKSGIDEVNVHIWPFLAGYETDNFMKIYQKMVTR